MWGRGRRRRRTTQGETWKIESPIRRVEGDRQEVHAWVAGSPIRFWSRDVPLRPSPEAFAGLMLIPALKQGARLQVAAPLDGTWMLGTRTLAGMFSRWWGYPTAYPIDGTRADRPVGAPAPGHGLCFTGGVDSFHALFTASSRYDHLVYVSGYETAYRDEAEAGPVAAERMARLELSLREVARETGKRLVILGSNARSHAQFASTAWEKTHGAGLAAAGHVLSDQLGSLTIPPSWTTDRLVPWGSHPETDVLWSSSRMRIRHADASDPRRDRVAAIAHYSLAQRHLRVCAAGDDARPNCSRCLKCVRTMLSLAGRGMLEKFETFDRDLPLGRTVDALPPVPPRYLPLWAELLDLDLEPGVRRHVERHMRRSRPSLWKRLRGRT